MSSDVIVIGAGLAGLTAARVLAEAARSVVVVEARERFGGRLLTIRPRDGGLPVELGAEFVHGRAPELIGLIEEAGLTTFEFDGKDACFEGGALTECRENGVFELLEELTVDADQTFSDFLKARNVPPLLADRAKQYVEGFNAADADRIGTASLAFQQQAEDAIDGGRAFRIIEGNDRLPAFLAHRIEAAGGHLLTSREVTAVKWSPGQVSVVASGETLTAKSAVITLPLGVLQAGVVQFTPVPQAALAAAHRMAMGSAARVTLDFRTRFWERKTPGLSFLFAQHESPRVWWTTAPRESGLLTGWIGGPAAAAAGSGLSQQAIAALTQLFNLKTAWLQQQLDGAYLHDWQRDRFSLGAYSYAPQGALSASAEMAQPIEGTLYFAGEHTDVTGHWGTMHGAIRSGLRAAAQLLESSR